MDKINAIAKKYNLIVIEDAAQAIGAKYKGKYAGSLCELGHFLFTPQNQFHVVREALSINDPRFYERAQFWEKGTDRLLVLAGKLNNISGWIRSSFLPSDLISAILYGQLRTTSPFKIIERKCLIHTLRF